jgi:hypothetical protein
MKNTTATKRAFTAALTEFATSLRDYVAGEDGQWSVKGFIDVYRNVFTVSSDTKIVSKILEIHIFPQLLAFCRNQRLLDCPCREAKLVSRPEFRQQGQSQNQICGGS